MKNMWNESMYKSFSILIALEICDGNKVQNTEVIKLKAILNKLSRRLTDLQNKIVVNKARRLIGDYEEQIAVRISEDYGYECEEDSFLKEIYFDTDMYELWKKAVREKKTVEISYDSISSGLTNRLVDPYKSLSPYIEGFCHTRNEVRKFRLDRVIDLLITGSSFKKK